MARAAEQKVGSGWGLVLLAFDPNRFASRAADDAMCAFPADTSGARRSADDERARFVEQYRAAAKAIRTSLAVSLSAVLAAIVAAIATGAVLRLGGFAKSPAMVIVLQYVSIGILLWATLARVEDRIATWGGDSLPERVDVWLYRVLYVVGSYVLALSVAW